MTRPGVTVLTPTIHGREQLLGEAIASVQVQTEPALAHLVLRDTHQAGPAVIRNLLLGKANTDLVAFLDDDDLLDDDHLERLGDAISQDDADLAFSWHRSVGAVPLVARFNEWGPEARAYMHSGINVIPVTVVARHASIIAAGGFNPADRWEDYSLWMRMLDWGATFVCVPVETWTYRMLGGNRTWA